MIRTYAFDLDRNTVDISTFSPWVMRQPEQDRSPLERQMPEKTDGQSRFSFPVDFAALAQRLDPKPAPAEVATDWLRAPGTVALWRPSGSGAVTKLADLSGNGNDLTPVSLAGSTGDQSVVSVSDDHGDGTAEATLVDPRTGTRTPLGEKPFRTRHRELETTVRFRADAAREGTPVELTLSGTERALLHLR